MKNYYNILRVSPTATVTEIKTAYRELAKLYHPDKTFDNKAKEEEFKEIQNAYSVLSNPKKRANYDLKFTTTFVKTNTNSYTPYTGNAYQYAQAQAINKNRSNKENSIVEEKPDRTEWYFVLISVVAAALLLYFII